MSKSLFIPVFLFIIVFAQAQSAEDLDKKNGFQDIILLSSAKGNVKLEFQKDVDHEKVPHSQVQYYEAGKGEYETIGTVKIKSLEAWAYDDQIFQIRVITKQDPDLYKGLRQVFGKPAYSVREDLYYWSGEKVYLTYQAVDKNKLELVYFSKLLDDILKNEKKEEIDDIANDF
jgi:hypothetical protein